MWRAILLLLLAGCDFEPEGCSDYYLKIETIGGACIKDPSCQMTAQEYTVYLNAKDLRKECKVWRNRD